MNLAPILTEKRVYARETHVISRENISENALKVLYRLKNAGYEALLVGGSVRDLLLGRRPKDFDVATNATPEDVRKLFKNCRIIGRRFRLAHVHFGDEIIEVATFRGERDADEHDEGERQIVDGMIVRDNVYGSLEEDARRRDFTVNSLYYNIKDFSVIDYVGGMDDLNARQLRLIGDPVTRYREDPVRMLRAVRFAGKLNFNIETETEKPLYNLAVLLEGVPPARLFEEVLKLFLSGSALPVFQLLRRYNLFHPLFSQTDETLSDDPDGKSKLFMELAMANTDSRVNEGKPVTPSFLFAVVLWHPLTRLYKKYLERGMVDSQAFAAAADAVMSGQGQRVSLPKRFHSVIREIWQLQERFEKRAPKRSVRLINHPRFRAAYDFLLLRASTGEVPAELADWWTQYNEADENSREGLIENAHRGRRHGGRRKHRR